MIVNIRIRDDLYNTLREKAKHNYRTITAELEIILSNALAEDTKNTKDTTTSASSTEIKEQPRKQLPRKNTIIGLESEEDLKMLEEEAKSKWI